MSGKDGVTAYIRTVRREGPVRMYRNARSPPMIQFSEIGAIWWEEKADIRSLFMVEGW